MRSSQALTLCMTALVVIACSGCVGGGGNAQTFDTNHGQIQIKTPETLEPTVLGSAYAVGMLSLGKKGSGGPLIVITLTENNAYSNFQNTVSMAKLMPLLDERDLTTNDNHKMHWSTVNVGGFKQYEGIIDYEDDKGLVVSIKGLSDTTDLMTGEKIPGFSESEYLEIFKSFKFMDSNSQSTQSAETTHAPTAQIEVPALSNEDNEKQRQQLINAIKELEDATLASIDYNTHQAADSYALLATAAELTTWWGEAARLTLDATNSVIGLVLTPGEFFTPDGAKMVLENPTKFTQIIQGVKDSQDILGAISTIDAFRGIFRDAESYHLNLDAVSRLEDVARQEYDVSKDNTRAANSAWLELWKPSTTDGLLIPLKSEGSAIWVNGLKATETEIKKSFDDAIEQVPDPLPVNYPLDETLTYLKDLTKELRRVDNRALGFNVVKDGEVQKKLVTLGMTRADFEVTSQLYDAWMNKQDVQYESTLYNTGETICSITTYGIRKGVVPVIENAKPIINGGSEALDYLDAIRFFKELPSEVAEEIVFKPADPLNALQGHSVGITNDLITETSNLWMVSSGTLGYLQHSWTDPESIVVEPIEAIDAPLSLSSREDSNTKSESIKTKTAFTHDGISYISKERVDENIKAGVAKPGDYEEVQVPSDTFVVGASTIPGET